MATKRPHVLVGGPVSANHEYAFERYWQALQSLDYPSYDVLLIDNSTSVDFYERYRRQAPLRRDGYWFAGVRERMVYCRNLMRALAMEGEYDYFFNIDQDVLPPQDALTRLVERNRPVVTGVYYTYYEEQGVREQRPILYDYFQPEDMLPVFPDDPAAPEHVRRAAQAAREDLSRELQDEGRLRQLTLPEADGAQLIRVRMCGTGCLLIHRSVLTAVPFRNNTDGAFDDVLFCHDVVTQLGLEIWADLGVKCRHLVEERPWRWEELP